MSAFDFAPLLAPGLPPPAAKWNGLAKYSFVGGNNDPDGVPVEALSKAMSDVLAREGKDLATYGLASGPQGYRRLREFLARKLERGAGIVCGADDILITSGSLQALDLVNGIFLARGDTVIIEQECYQGSINRLTRLGVNVVGIPLDRDGMRMDALAVGARRSQAPRRAPEIHLHHSDRAEPDRHDLKRGAPARIAAPRLRTRRADFRGRLLCRSHLGRQTAARALRHEPRRLEQKRRRHPYRLVLQVDRAGAARRLHRRPMGAHFAHAGDQDRRRLRRARADGARRILPDAFRGPCAGTDARTARQTGNHDGCAQRAFRHGGRVRRSERRHFPLGQAAGSGRHAQALPGGARRRRRHQSGPGMVGRQEL